MFPKCGLWAWCLSKCVLDDFIFCVSDGDVFPAERFDPHDWGECCSGSCRIRHLGGLKPDLVQGGCPLLFTTTKKTLKNLYPLLLSLKIQRAGSQREKTDSLIHEEYFCPGHMLWTIYCQTFLFEFVLLRHMKSDHGVLKTFLPQSFWLVLDSKQATAVKI